MNYTDTELYQAIAIVVRRLRLQQKLTPTDLITQAAITPATHHAMDTARPIDIPHYIAIANALSISPGTLLDLAISHATLSPQAQYRNTKPIKPSP